MCQPSRLNGGANVAASSDRRAVGPHLLCGVSFFVTVADASGSGPRSPLVVERPSSYACWLEAATSRGRDVCVAAYEWPPIRARRKIVALRLRPGAEENTGAGARRDRR